MDIINYQAVPWRNLKIGSFPDNLVDFKHFIMAGSIHDFNFICTRKYNNNFIHLNMLKSCVFLVTIFFTSCTVIYSQKQDYIINTSNDTVYGNVKVGIFGKKARFEQNDSTIDCTAENTKAYYLWKSKRTFEIIKPEGEKKFMWLQRFENGRIKLYSQEVNAGNNMTLTIWYARKDDGVTFELRGSGAYFGAAILDERKARLCRLFSDNAEIMDKCDKMKKFNFKYIYPLVEEYNKKMAR
jgi:hypothetical protein